MVETRISSATSATVKNRAFAWDSTLASLLRACGHCTPVWLLWPVSNDQRGVQRGTPGTYRMTASALPKLPGAFGGGLHGLDEGAADAPALELAQSCGGGAAGRG